MVSDASDRGDAWFVRAIAHGRSKTGSAGFMGLEPHEQRYRPQIVQGWEAAARSSLTETADGLARRIREGPRAAEDHADLGCCPV